MSAARAIREPGTRRARPQGPIRTCVGCRKTEHKSALLRVVWQRGRVVADVAARASGRGAYLHFSNECLESALARGGFSRAFRTRVANQNVQLSLDKLAAWPTPPVATISNEGPNEHRS